MGVESGRPVAGRPRCSGGGALFEQRDADRPAVGGGVASDDATGGFEARLVVAWREEEADDRLFGQASGGEAAQSGFRNIAQLNRSDLAEGGLVGFFGDDDGGDGSGGPTSGSAAAFDQVRIAILGQVHQAETLARLASGGLSHGDRFLLRGRKRCCYGHLSTPTGRDVIGSFMDGPIKVRFPTVHLIGAGPGDPSLLTQAALNILRQADAVVFDALIDRRLLDLLPAHAERIDAGKRAKKQAMSQQQIHELLLTLSARHGCVVRLKGGDPLVFARGAEEIEFLTRHGVSCRVVPGITAAMAGLLAAGIAPTHRDRSPGLLLATGHTAAGSGLPGEAGQVGLEGRHAFWSAAVAEGVTVVLYMAAAGAADHLRCLQRAGTPADTPAAMVQWASWDRQLSVAGTVQTLPDQIAASGIGPPAVLIVGRQAAHRLDFSPGWLPWSRESAPCGVGGEGGDRVEAGSTGGAGRAGSTAAGAAVLLLSSDGRVDTFARAWRRQQAWRVRTVAMIRIVDPPDASLLAEAVLRLSDVDWLVLCSPNGVRRLERALLQQQRDSRALAGVRLAVVGQATGQELKARLGVTADLVGQSGGSAGMIDQWLKRPDCPDHRSNVLVLKSEQSVSDWSRLREVSGATVLEVVAYRAQVVTGFPRRIADMLQKELFSWVVIKSPTLAEGFAAAIQKLPAGIALPPICSIGPTTSARLRELGLPPAVEGAYPTAEHLAQAMIQSASDGGRRC